MAGTDVHDENFIGGRWVPARSGATTDVVDPATGAVVFTAPDSGPEDVDDACRAAAEAFRTWGRTTPAERMSALLKFADAIEARTDDIVAVEHLNAGKPIAATGAEVEASVDCYRFFAGACRTMETQGAGEYLEGYTSMLRREPIGVVASIAPWNYPFMMAAWKLGPALAAGNCVVLKPSELTPMSSLLLAEIAADVFPPGVVNVVAGGKQTGATLVEHPLVEMVSLTGSVETGRKIAEAASKSLKRVHLELGGKAPVLVLDDADLDVVAEAIKIGGYWNAGQDCTAATRVIAGAGVHDAAVEAIVEAARSLVVGPTTDERTELGPVISARAARAGPGLRRAGARRGRHGRHRRHAPRRRGLLLRAVGDHRRRPGLRDRPARGVRPGRHGPAGDRPRGRGRDGERRRLRAGGLGVHQGRRPGDGGERAAALRHGVGQRPHPARVGDAPRRLQAVGLRQGHVAVRGRALHGAQARDGQVVSAHRAPTRSGCRSGCRDDRNDSQNWN
jgi:acyl-CoA reductase-like NAD-dependent aldehyde dehydrogenase